MTKIRETIQTIFNRYNININVNINETDICYTLAISSFCARAYCYPEDFSAKEREALKEEGRKLFYEERKFYNEN